MLLRCEKHAHRLADVNGPRYAIEAASRGIDAKGGDGVGTMVGANEPCAIGAEGEVAWVLTAAINDLDEGESAGVG